MEGCLINICWFFLAGHAIAFLLTFSIGTNDAASSFGTSIGSGVLTQTQASILAGFFEISGAVLLGTFNFQSSVI
jgi:phosphate/sulfate permease